MLMQTNTSAPSNLTVYFIPIFVNFKNIRVETDTPAIKIHRIENGNKNIKYLLNLAHQ